MISAESIELFLAKFKPIICFELLHLFLCLSLYVSLPIPEHL